MPAQVRPLLDSEKAKSCAVCVDVPNNTTVQLPPRKGTAGEPFRFDFDRVYKMSNPGQLFLLSACRGKTPSLNICILVLLIARQENMRMLS